MGLQLESKFCLCCFWILSILCTLFKELNLSSTLGLVLFLWFSLIIIYVSYYVCCFVFVCIKKHKSKKTNIEKLIDEEEKK